MKQERNTLNTLFEPKTAVKLVLLFSTSVILARYIWTAFGGWITGDEAIYAWSMIKSSQLDMNVHFVTTHMLYTTINIIFARAFALDNIFKILTFYLCQALVWNTVAVVSLYYVLEEISVSKIAKSLTIYSLPCLAIFTVMNSLYLTEAPGLAFAFLGTAFLLRAVKGNNWKNMIPATVGLCVSAIYREPFLMLLGVIGLMLIYMTARKQLNPRLLLIFCVIAFILTPAPEYVVKLPLSDTYNSARNTAVSALETITSWIPVSHNDPIVNDKDIMINESDTEFIPYTYYYSDTTLTTVFQPVAPPLSYSLWMGTRFFLLGSGTGWSFILFPLGVLGFVLCSLKLWRNRGNNDPTDKMLWATITGSFLTHWVLGIILVRSTYFESPLAYGTIFRFSYTTIPAIVGLVYVYNYVKPRHLKYLLAAPALLIICAVLVAPMIQSNQSIEAVNRIDPGYKAPYYRVYEQLVSTKTPALVYVDPAMRISLFMDGVEHVTLKQMIINKTRFDALFHEYKGEVYLYQEKWPLYQYVIEEHYFVIRDILAGTTEYEVVTVWETPEAYLYKVTMK